MLFLFGGAVLAVAILVGFGVRAGNGARIEAETARLAALVRADDRPDRPRAPLDWEAERARLVAGIGDGLDGNGRRLLAQGHVQRKVRDELDRAFADRLREKDGSAAG